MSFSSPFQHTRVSLRLLRQHLVARFLLALVVVGLCLHATSSGVQAANKPKDTSPEKLRAASSESKKDASTRSKSLAGTMKETQQKSAQKKKLGDKPFLRPEATSSEKQLYSTLPSFMQKNLKLYADAVHNQDRAVLNELKDTEEDSSKDLAMLWQAAVERSSTIRYAIEKLSNPDTSGKPVSNSGFTTRLVQSMARVGGAAGSMMTGNPMGLLGGSLIQDLVSEDPMDALNNAKRMRVSDTDMVILAKAVETLQTDLLEAYFDYRSAMERLTLAKEARSKMAFYLDSTHKQADQTYVSSLEPVMESLYQTTAQHEASARQAVGNTKNHLLILVGPDALSALEEAHSPSSSQVSVNVSP
jgi:hypothetical protein